MCSNLFKNSISNTAQSAGAVEYTDCPGYATKQFDDEVPVMMELWEMQNTPSLLLLPGPLWLGLVALDRALNNLQWLICHKTQPNCHNMYSWF